MRKLGDNYNYEHLLTLISIIISQMDKGIRIWKPCDLFHPN